MLQEALLMCELNMYTPIYFLAESPNLIPLIKGNMEAFHRPFIPSKGSICTLHRDCQAQAAVYSQPSRLEKLWSQ